MYVYRRSVDVNGTAVWSLEFQYMDPSSTLDASFGAAVGVYDDWMLVGQPYIRGDGGPTLQPTEAGTVTAFQYSSASKTWTRRAILRAFDPRPSTYTQLHLE